MAGLALAVLPLAAQNAASPNRLALVVGNATYTEGIPALANPANDAQDIAAALQSNGWKVALVQDASRRDFSRRITEFQDQIKANPGATALFYYAGHGVQVDGKNYLLPIGEVFETAADVKDSAFLIDRVVDIFNETKVRQSVIILDACRDNPFAQKSRSIGGTRGLSVLPANEAAEEGSAVIFATAPNDTAADGEGRNGVFTAALLKQMDAGLDLPNLFKNVREEVQSQSGGAQNPSIVTSGLLSKFYLGKSPDATASSPAPVAVAAKLPAAVESGSFKLIVKGPVDGMDVRIDGAAAGVTPLETSLPKGVHSVELQHPDWAAWKDSVKPNLSGVVELQPTLARSTTWQIGQLTSQKQSLEQKLGLLQGPRAVTTVTGTAGWVIGALGAGAAVASYFIGTNARATYDAATSVADAANARDNLELYGTLFQAGIFAGGGGILVGLASALFTPDSAPLERDLKSVNSQLQSLEATK